MSQPQNQNQKPILLRVNSNVSDDLRREEIQSNLTQAEKDAQDAFKPRQAGKCCKNVWAFYCLGCCSCCCQALVINPIKDENEDEVKQGTNVNLGTLTRCIGVCCGSTDEEDDDIPAPYCCDTEHLTMHILFLSMMVTIYILFDGIGRSLKAEKEPTEFYTIFAVGGAFCILVIIFIIIQINRTLCLRMYAAKIMDYLDEFEVERKKLAIALSTTALLKTRLEEVDKDKSDIISDLKKVFRDSKRIKQNMDNADALADQSEKVTMLLLDRFKRIEQNLEAALIESEKAIIEAIYEGMHMKDGKKGLDKEEYEAFTRKCGKKYEKHFKMHLNHFDEYAGDDGILDRRELFMLLDKASREEALKDDEDLNEE